MSHGTIYVDCPCCGAKIEVRREDGKTVQHWQKSKTDTDADPLKAAAERLKAEKSKRERFNLAEANRLLEAQKRKALDKFEAEKKRVAEEGDVSRPPNPFDFD